MIIQTFYNGFTQYVQSIIDMTAGGSIMNKIGDETDNLIEAMTLNDFE